AVRSPPWLRLCRHYSHWHTRWSQSRVPPQVLRRRREEEFVVGAAWPPQPQAPEPEVSLEVGKQHLDLFPAAASSLIFRCRGESPGKSRASSCRSRGSLRATAFGQQRALSSQTSQSFLLVR